jgi:hypothetical protein
MGEYLSLTDRIIKWFVYRLPLKVLRSAVERAIWAVHPERGADISPWDLTTSMLLDRLDAKIIEAADDDDDERRLAEYGV